MTKEQLEKHAEGYALDDANGEMLTYEQLQNNSKHFIAGVNWALREFKELTKDKPRISLNTFLFSLNQDEDILVSVMDYDSDEVFFATEWKSCLAKKDIYNQYKDWLVIFFESGRVGQYNSCLNIYISKEDPDND